MRLPAEKEFQDAEGGVHWEQGEAPPFRTPPGWYSAPPPPAPPHPQPPRPPFLPSIHMLSLYQCSLIIENLEEQTIIKQNSKKSAVMLPLEMKHR